MQKKQKTGFSLIELSVVILIISILITGSLGISKTAINNSRSKITKERMDVVYKAFSNFLANNRRLPCPALLTVAKGTSAYGSEAATPGTCTNTYVSSTNASNLVYGMVPIAALGLEPDMAEDGWGTKFVYVADKRFTKQSAAISTPPTDGFEITKSALNANDNVSTTDLGGIDVQGPAATSLTANKNGIFLLLSHGANKFNGFNATGTSQNGTSTVTDENDNSCNTCSTSGTTSYDREFIASSTDPNFDDIVLFKNKAQLVKDAGLEYIMCNAAEATLSGGTAWTLNGAYGCYVCSNLANNGKICGKYGVWSAPLNTTCAINTSACLNGLSSLDMVIYSDQKTSTTTGGTFTSGAWQTRTLNTTKYIQDTFGSFSLSSNRITLQPGRYLIEASAPAFFVFSHQAKFRNITDSTDAILGTSEYSDANTGSSSSRSVVNGVITITSAKVFELQHNCVQSRTNNGFGVAGGVGVNSEYSVVKITKLN